MSLTTDDRLELHEMPGRYGDAIDQRAWDRLPDLFTTDAVFELAHRNHRLEGLTAIVHFMAEEATHPGGHLMTNIHVDATPDGATLRARVILPAVDGDTVRVGSYVDEVVRTDQGWRIRHRVYRPG